MRFAVFALVLLCSCFAVPFATPLQSQTSDKPAVSALQANSLCAKDEHIIFSCPVKRAAKLPAKIVSLCASRDLDKERGYLQYRFGLPGKVELEFPKSRQGTQQMFRYSHYFRYQVDLTEINFNIDGYEYQIFDDYNGEEKPAISTQGVSVTAPGKPKEVSFVCRSKPKADYSTLQDVLPHASRRLAAHSPCGSKTESDLRRYTHYSLRRSITLTFTASRLSCF
jgi:hypothetical protein